MPLLSHQIATFPTPLNGTNPIDANTVRGNDNSIGVAYNQHDADPTIHVQNSILASRPAPAIAGRFWLTSDGLRLYYDNGGSWSEVNYVPIIAGVATVAAGINLNVVNGPLIQGNNYRRPGTSVNVGTMVLTIDTLLYGGIGHVVVTGDDGSSNKFIDTVAYQAPSNVVVISSSTLQGAPSARTYSVLTSALRLAMAANTYTVKVAPQEIV
jgi:hypothetical protein